MTGYATTEELVAAEANGWAVIAIISDGKRSWPWVVGPFDSQDEAKKARARERTRFKRQCKEDGRTDLSAKYFVRPIWKEGVG